MQSKIWNPFLYFYIGVCLLGFMMWQPVSSPQTLSGATFKWSWKSQTPWSLPSPKKEQFCDQGKIYNLFGFLQDHFDEEFTGEVDLEALALMLGVEKVANKELTSSWPSPSWTSPPGDQKGAEELQAQPEESWAKRGRGIWLWKTARQLSQWNLPDLIICSTWFSKNRMTFFNLGPSYQKTIQ